MSGRTRRFLGPRALALTDALLSRSREVGAVRAQLGEVAAALARIETDLGAARTRIEDLALAAAHADANQARQLEATRLAVEDEAAVRRLLRIARSSPDYELPWTDPNPLVSVCIPTYTRWKTLVEVAIPSVLEQTHTNVEIVVVGDASPVEVGAALERLNDSRVRFENLPYRGPYPDEPTELWHVAGTGPLNRAMELARGHWIAVLNDDDSFRPHHISTLLECARESHAEVAYGSLIQHEPDGSTKEIRSFPPRSHEFGWQAAIQHHGMTLFEFELGASVFGDPGDWHRARRMLRAGVRFMYANTTVGDYWPSTLWQPS